MKFNFGLFSDFSYFYLLMTAIGTLKLESGSKYVGDFKNDKIHGTGIYYFADGRIYEGGFDNDTLHGYGVMTE